MEENFNLNANRMFFWSNRLSNTSEMMFSLVLLSASSK